VTAVVLAAIEFLILDIDHVRLIITQGNLHQRWAAAVHICSRSAGRARGAIVRLIKDRSGARDECGAFCRPASLMDERRATKQLATPPENN